MQTTHYRFIGNEDRHAGNWLVDDKQLHLIVYGLAFPAEPYSLGNHSLLEQAKAREYEVSNDPTRKFTAPSDCVRSCLNQRSEIVEPFNTADLPDDSMCAGHQRIGRLSKEVTGFYPNKATSWNSL